MPPDDKILNKTKKWINFGVTLSKGLALVITPLLVMYLEMKPQIEEAKVEASNGYEAIIPAIVEIQGILNTAKDWAQDTDDEIHVLMAAQKTMSDRLVRCETYMDILSRRRGLPRAPTSVVGAPISSKPPKAPYNSPVQRSVKYRIPDSIKKAKAKVNARKAAKCSSNDPLCGNL